MAVKKAKAKAQRAAPKGKGKAKAKPAKKAPRAKSKSQPKSQPKTRAKPTKKRSVETVAAAPPQLPLDLFPAEAPSTVETMPPEAKKGRLARLAGGVGNLLARMTGRKSDRSLDQTIELATSDILAETSAPPPIPKRKR